MNLSSTRCINTARVWEIQGMFQICFQPGVSLSVFEKLPGVVVNGETVTLEHARIKQSYTEPGKMGSLSVYVGATESPVRFDHVQIRQIRDHEGIVWIRG